MSKAGAKSAADVERGQRIYTPLVLRAYDLFVLEFSNRFAWQCPSLTMLDRYERHVGRRHLDLGVGTGWYLDRCTWPVEQPEITLFDLNENAFSPAARRLARYAPRAVRANVLDPLPLGDARFESAAANYLLHCLPGRSDSKAATLATNVRPYPEPGGVLFGSTILGSGVTHSIGRRLTKGLQRDGNLLERRGRRARARAGLGGHVRNVQIEVVGAVALFAVWA